MSVTKEHNYREAFVHPAREVRVLSILALGLFYIALNISSVFFQARGVPASQTVFSLLAYLIGIPLWSWSFHYLILRLNRCGAGSTPAMASGILVAALLLPPLFCQFSSLFTWQGAVFINIFQPFLWSMHVPLAHYYFFKHVSQSSQAFLFSVALSAGHLCWALLMPLASYSGMEGITLFSGLEGRHLQFINFARNLVSVVLALICWRLTLYEPDQLVSKSLANRSSDPSAFPVRKFCLLLLPFAACFFLNGFTGYLFSPRLFSRGFYPEFMHLILALLFPVAGFIISGNGDRALLRFICGTVLVFALLPLLLVLTGGAGLPPIIYLACGATQQLMLFCGSLAACRFAQFSRVPSLTCCAVFILLVITMPGKLLAEYLIPLLNIPPQVIVGVLAGLCIFSIVAFRRAFPLPVLPVLTWREDEVRPPGAVEPLKEVKEAAKLSAFAQAFGLTGRETQVLDGLVRQLKVSEISRQLSISESTVRFHQTGLFRKTAQPSRRSILIFYNSWTSDKK